ncbi:MAG: STAS-like domain-containing protein [Nitrospira sp.]|nr:STAS-like domain-containing protein [Nitrospira sp.]
MNSVRISVFEVVGSPLCVASNDGQRVYERLAAAIQEGRSAVLSFHNVDTLTSAFLNAAIGQLYGKFSENDIRSLVQVEDMAPDDLVLVKRVVDTAKQYFKDPPRFDEVIRETMEDQDDGV